MPNGGHDCFRSSGWFHLFIGETRATGEEQVGNDYSISTDSVEDADKDGSPNPTLSTPHLHVRGHDRDDERDVDVEKGDKTLEKLQP